MADQTAVRFTGPLAAQQEALRTALLAQGYTRLSTDNLLRLASSLSRWLEAHTLGVEELNTERIGLDPAVLTYA